MVSGYWTNQDGLPLQYGVLKAQPELGGDYLIYGETREIEQVIALVPTQFGTGGIQIPAAPTSFSGTGTPIQAGIQSMTTMFPLQTTAVNTGGTTITLLNPQVFIESVELDTLIGATGGTSLSVGFVTTTSGASSGFAQVSDGTNTSGHILNAAPIAAFSTAGQKILYTKTGTFGFDYQVPGTLRAGGGFWVGTNVPITTTTATGVANTPLANQAFFSSIAAGTFTNGLVKIRVRYFIYGNINY